MVFAAPTAFAQDECGPNVANATVTCPAGSYAGITYTGSNGLTVMAGPGVVVSTGGLTNSGTGDLVITATGAAVTGGITGASTGGEMAITATTDTTTAPATTGITATAAFNATVTTTTPTTTGITATGAGIAITSSFGTAKATINGSVTAAGGAGLSITSGTGSVTADIVSGASVTGSTNGLVVSGGFGANSINNFGAITATTAGATALSITGPNAPSTFLNNGGAITAGAGGTAIQLGAGADTVNLFSGSAITGMIRGGAGADAINLFGGTNTKTATQVLTDNVEFEQLNVNSGFWTVTGVTAVPNILIGTGTTLQVDDLAAKPASLSGLTALTDNGRLVYFTDVSGAISAPITGNGALTKSGAGALTLSGANAYTGTTSVDAGTLINTGAIAGDVNVALGATFNLGDLTTTGTVGGDILNNGTLNFRRTNDYTFAGAIAGTGTLNKEGAAKLTLSRLDTFSGNINVSAGTLAGSTLSTPGALNISSGAAVQLASNPHFLGTLQGASGSTLDIAGGSLTLLGSASSTFDGAITGAASLIKTGAGTLTLGGANTFTGTTSINAGAILLTGSLAGGVDIAAGTSLQVGAGATGGTVGGNIFNSGTLTFNRTADSTFAGALTGGGALVKTGAGKLTMSQLGTVGGNITVNQGILAGNKLSTSGALSIASGAGVQLAADTHFLGGTLTGAAGSSLSIAGGSLTLANAADQTFAGVISGAGGLTKQGAGQLTLSGANTYTGTTTLQTGSILLTGSLTGDAVINSGTSLLVGSGGTTGSIAGDILNNGALTFNRSNDSTFAGAIAGTGTLVKSGAGRLTMSHLDQFSGNINVTAGTLAGPTLSTPGALTISTGAGVDLGSGASFLGALQAATGSTLNIAGGSLTLVGAGDSTDGGVITGAGGLNKQGAGTLTLSGANTYTGTTSVQGGKLTLTGSLAGGVDIATGTTVQVGSGPLLGAIAGNIFNNGTLQVVSTTDQTLAGSLTGSGALQKTGAGKLTLNQLGQYGGNIAVDQGILASAKLSTPGALSIANGASVQLGSETHSLGTLSGVAGSSLSIAGGSLALNGATDQTFAGVISGAGGLIKQGAGQLTLSGANTFTGATTLQAGSVLLTGSLTADATINSGTSLLVGSGGTTGSIAGDILNNGALTFNRSNPYTFAGALAGTGTLTKTGAGVLTVTHLELFSGNIAVAQGTLVAPTLSTSGSLSVATGAAVQLGANTHFLGSLAGATGSTLSIAGGSLTLLGSGSNTFDGVISGAASLIKQGTGQLTLSGANSFTGATTLQAGSILLTGSLLGDASISSGATLLVGSGGATGSITGDILNNGALTFNRSNALTFAGAIVGTGTLNKAGAGVLTMTHLDQFSGNINVAAGTLAAPSLSTPGILNISGGASVQLGNASHFLGTLQGAVGSSMSIAGGSLTLLGNPNATFDGVISGAGGLNKQGTGALTLSGANTYTGLTSVQAGSLALTGSLAGNVSIDAGASLAIQGTGTVGGAIANNGDLTIARTGDHTLAGNISGAGALAKTTGTGKTTLSGIYSATGGITVQSGTLQFDHLAMNSALNLLNGADIILGAGAHSATGISTGVGSIVTLNGATLTLAPTTTGNTYSGLFAGTGGLVKDGIGSLNLTGANTYTGATVVNAGTLFVNGSITSNVAVNSGGILSGSGAINGNITLNTGGRLATGNSAGTMNVNGGVTFATGSSLTVETQANGTSDRLTATGAVTIQPGVAVHVTPLGLVGDYSRLSHYTILSGSAVTGTFATIDSSLAFLDPHLVYSANQVQMDLTRNDVAFASVGETANQKLVGAAVEASGYGTTLYDLLVTQDAAGSRTAFDALSGEAYNTIGAGLIGLGEDIRNLRARAPTPYRNEYSAWSKAFSGEATGAGSSETAGLSGTRSGVLFGGNSMLDGMHAGGSFGFLSSSMDVDGRATEADVTTISLEGHAGFAVGQFSARAGVDYANHQVKASRRVVFTGLSDAETASFTANEFGAMAEAAWALRWPYESADPDAFFEPFTSLSWQRVSMDAFSESGGAAALTATPKDRDVLFLRLGARGDVTWSGVTLAGSYALRHAGGGANAASDMAFNTGAAFKVNGVALDADASELQLEVSTRVMGGKASVSYAGVFGDQWESTTANASLSFGF